MPRVHRRSRSAFTLVELMVVIAIVGILITIALPRLTDLQLRTKRSELALNINGIKVGVMARDADYGGYISADPYPGVPHKSGVPWVVADSGNFRTISWAPDGLIRGTYSVIGENTTFIVRGETDVDGDGNRARWEATETLEPRPMTFDDVY